MKRVALFIVLAGALAGAAAGLAPTAVAKEKDKVPPPAGCHWQEIPVLKAHLAIPDGWLFRDNSTGPNLSYEVQPASPGLENAKARYRLEVRRGIKKADVVARASEYIESARAGAAESEPVEQGEAGALTLFSCTVTFAAKGAGGGATRTALTAAANAQTGTLYTIRFDIPEDEVDRVAPLAKPLLQTMRLDNDI
jgi:hypothetical protein